MQFETKRSTRPGFENETPVRRLALTRRRTGGLLRFWLAGLAIAAGLFWIGRMMPAARDLLVPGYWILGAFVLFFTVRWYRPRRGDRRRRDRRERRAPDDDREDQ